MDDLLDYKPTKTMKPHILLVAATEHETKTIRYYFEMKPVNEDVWSYESAEMKLHLMHTGIGMVNTAFALGKYLAGHKIAFAINFGIAGSFDRNIPIGEVVEVIKDSFSELGADSPEGFLDLEQMGFPLIRQDGINYYNVLENLRPHKKEILQVKGITVNQVAGRETEAKIIQERWNCEIETMEGAAFFHAMIKEKIPFLAYRGISNYVENRNKLNWNIPLAAKNVQIYVTDKLPQILEHLSNSY